MRDTAGQALAAAAAAQTWPGLRVRPELRATLLLLAPMLLFIFLSRFFVSTDPDYWWHVRTGQYIYETGSLPRVDTYSYTAAGRPWVTHEWLTELLLYVLYRQFGYVANVVWFGLVTALTWATVYASCRRRGMGEIGATALMFWGFVMAAAAANVRPQAWTTLFLAVCALLLTRYKQGEVRALWLLLPLLALWVNLHGGYVIGLALLGLTIVGEALARGLGRPAAPLRPLLAVAVLSTAATLLNPHGFEALVYPFSYAGTGNASMQYLNEWQSPDFHVSYLLIFAASLLPGLVLGLGRRPLGPTEAFWALAFAFMGLQSVRHIPLYAVIVMPLLGARLQAEIPVFRRRLAAWRRPQLLTVTWPLLAVALLSVASQAKLAGPQVGREPSAVTYPVGAVTYLREHDLQGNLFNQYHWGGYLIDQLYPQRQVFIDGRADVYGDAFVRNYVDVSRLRPNWRQVLDDYEVRLVLVEKDSPLAVVLGGDSNWQEVYNGEVERLFARRFGHREVVVPR